MSERRLAHAGRADEAEDGLASALGGAAVLAQLPHREVLDDALLDLVEVVMVVVEDRARLGHVDLAAGGRVPRQRDHQVEVGADDRRLGRRARDALEARDLAVGLALGLGRKPCLLDPLAKLAQLGLVAIELAQLALDGLQLLAQEVLALGLAHRFLGLRLDLAAELEHLELVRHVAEELLQLLPRRIHLEEVLALVGGEPDVVGDVVREVHRFVDRTCRARQLGRQLRRERHELLERCDHATKQCLSLDRRLLVDNLGVNLDARRQVRLFRDGGAQLDAAHAEHRQLHRSVRQLEHVLDAHHRADVMEIVECDLLRRLVELRGHRDVPIAGGQVLEQLERAAAAH